FEYVELAFRDVENRFTAHCDGVLDWNLHTDPFDLIEVLELKTINERGYDLVDPSVGGNPNPGHLAQVNGYMWLSGIDHARIMYVKKGDHPFDSVLCEHEVVKDEAIVDAIKSMLKRSRDVVDNFSQKDELPIRLSQCKKKSDKRAKYCSMKGPCFAK
ncbi:MAG: hypothetical protein KAJ19_09330, partial [Gammaproteobacteria bacterium]|nr:hypothetical protein [Gammaproteobacteria bacterium]